MYIQYPLTCNFFPSGVKLRNRKGEDLISLDYLKSLEEYTNKWISDEKQKNLLTVLELNGNQEKNEIINKFDIDKFIKSLLDYETVCH